MSDVFTDFIDIISVYQRPKNGSSPFLNEGDGHFREFSVSAMNIFAEINVIQD